MKVDTVWNATWGTFRFIIGICFLLWALYLIFAGSELLSFDDPNMQMGGLTLLVSGLIWLAPSFVGFIYDRMKARAPAKRSERPTEPDEVTFDADAALERYLAAKRERGPTEAVPAAPVRPAAPASGAPVFGRRGTLPKP